MQRCQSCGKPLDRKGTKYCSNKCQGDNAYKSYIAQWKQNKLDGSRGIVAKNISAHVRRYLISTHGEKCSLCGWDTRSPSTGKVPLEIDHIDGNPENHSETNLRLLCPNCHSLTPSFRNLNRGHGRSWRREKYIRHDNQ